MNYNKILVLSPHTDDAELGCGGFIAKMIENKKELLWVVFSTAEESLPAHMPPDTLISEFKLVSAKLGLKPSQTLINNFKVRKLHEKRQEILELLIKIRNEFSPDLVIGPSLNDYHQDHQVVANEMIRAFKMSCSIICYELPWNHLTFQSQLFVKLDDKHLDLKISLLDLYKSQQMIKRHYFSEEFIRGLAYTRGAQINHKYAEAFDVVRWIEK